MNKKWAKTLTEKEILVDLRHTLRCSFILRKRKLNHFYLYNKQRSKLNNSMEEQGEKTSFIIVGESINWYKFCEK